MKKRISLALCIAMLLSFCAYGGASAAGTSTAADATTTEWTRQGYFADENENMLYIGWTEETDEPGWYALAMLGELTGGGMLAQDGDTLQGGLISWEDENDTIPVIISEEGEDGLLLAVEDGESYHFTPYEMPEATIFVSINTEGWGGMIDYAEGEEAPEIDPEWPFQSAQINLAEPTTYTFAAAAEEGVEFVKWTKNGEDFSTEPVITVLLDESADFIAVFEEGSSAN